MKTCMTLALLSAAAMATISDAANCDFGEIQSKLYPNATEGLKKCATETGIDIWAIANFPTEKQAQTLMTSRNCVDYLNQINERANKEIQCDIKIADTTKGFGSFITDLLTGQTGNQTESASGSDEVEVPEENTNAKAKASLLDGSSSSSKKTATTPKPTTATPAPTSAAASTSLSAVTAGVIAVIGLALQW
ncbi:Elicitin-like protein [Globisporangium polare]